MINEYIVTYRNKWEKQTRREIFRTETLALNWCHEQKYKRDFKLTRINNAETIWSTGFNTRNITLTSNATSSTFHREYSNNFYTSGGTWHTR